MPGQDNRTESVAPTGLEGYQNPTILELWAPSCAECRAMQPHLDAAAADFSDTVDLVRVNAAANPDVVRTLHVMGTPTLIGVHRGVEVFRFTGRRSRAELGDLFRAVAVGADATGVGAQDVLLRVGTGVVLVGIGLVTGPAWSLAAIGAAVTAFGLFPWLTRRR